MSMVPVKQPDGPFGMTPTEVKQAEDITRGALQDTLRHLTNHIHGQFPSAGKVLDFEGSAVEKIAIKIKVKTILDGEQLQTLQSLCKEIEDRYAYPEISFKVTQVTSFP